MKDLTVVVLTHNRESLLIETIKSILNQDCNDFIFIVSDNSSNDKTYISLKNNNLLGRFIYKRRREELTSLNHFNLILSEIKTGYFIMFHDDDIMESKMISTLYNTIHKTNYSAVGCNASIFCANKSTNKHMFKRRKNLVLNTPDDLIKQYCKLSIVPFSSYIYSRKKVENLVFNMQVGKYSDVIWLLNISIEGKILWLSKSYMQYRRHIQQDSAVYDYINQLLLIKQYKVYAYDKKRITKYITKCRIALIYFVLIQKFKKEFKLTEYKKKQILLFLYYSPFNYFFKTLIRITLRKF